MHLLHSPWSVVFFSFFFFLFYCYIVQALFTRIYNQSICFGTKVFSLDPICVSFFFLSVGFVNLFFSLSLLSLSDQKFPLYISIVSIENWEKIGVCLPLKWAEFYWEKRKRSAEKKAKQWKLNSLNLLSLRSLWFSRWLETFDLEQNFFFRSFPICSYCSFYLLVFFLFCLLSYVPEEWRSY